MKKILSILAALLVFSLCFCSAYADVIPPSITVSPAGSGTTSQVGQPSDAPPQITYQASSNAGYVFEGWYENGSCISQNATELFDADRNRSLVAQFAPVTYTVSVSASPNDGGTVRISSPDHPSPYSLNENITVVANPNQGFTFTNWTENGEEVSSSSSFSFTLTSNRNLVANFVPAKYHVTAVAGTGGTASGSGDYQAGTAATITAVPDSDYVFSGWEIESATIFDNPYTITVNADVTATAVFTKKPKATYSVTATAGAGGTATGSGSYQAGTDATITATANSGYVFSRWEIGDVSIFVNPYTFPVNADVIASAVFSKNPNTYTITYMPGADCATQPTYTDSSVGTTAYLRGQTYLKSGYTQTGWSLSQGGQKVYDLDKTYTISGNLTLYPFWTKNVGTLKLTVNYSGEGVVYLNGAKVTSGAVYDVPEGLSYTFQMSPNSKEYYVYSINFAGKYWNANVDTDKFCVTYDMMKAENRTLTIRFDSVTASPKTGDDSHLLLWSVLGGVSLVAAATGAVLKKKSKI